MNRFSEEIQTQPTTPWLHALAIITAAATFPLIFSGGLVTSKHAGLAVPDWPNSYGYNMFLFPPSKWVGGILFEHVHRLGASTVGMLTIALNVIAWRSSAPKWIKNLCAWQLVAVVFQGVLGGLRVILVNLDLAIVHGCVAQAFFCLAAFTALATSPWWRGARSHSDELRSRSLFIAGVACTIVIYLQLMVGATMRHFDAGLAIPDFPKSFGHWLPPTHLDYAARIDAMRRWPDPELHLGTVTMLQVYLQFAHRLGAIVVSVAIGIFASVILARFRKDRFLFRGAVALLALLATQITLGACTVWFRKPADVASLHVAVGALVLMCAAITTAAAMRLYFRRTSAAPLPSVKHGAVQAEHAIAV